MTIKEFIETAIEGGYINTSDYGEKGYDYMVNLFSERIEKVVLNPEAWKAVSKVQVPNPHLTELARIMMVESLMKRMIDALIKGKSLEEYIATL